MEQYSEMNEKQKARVKRYMIEILNKQYFEIENSVEFFEARVNHVISGAFKMERVSEINILVTSNLKIKEGDKRRSNFIDLFPIPPC
jgi:hypothetical protein